MSKFRNVLCSVSKFKDIQCTVSECQNALYSVSQFQTEPISSVKCWSQFIKVNILLQNKKTGHCDQSKLAEMSVQSFELELMAWCNVYYVVAWGCSKIDISKVAIAYILIWVLHSIHL